MARIETNGTPISSRNFLGGNGCSFSSSLLPKGTESRLSPMAIKDGKNDNPRRDSRFNLGDWKKSEKGGLEALHAISEKKELSGHRYKESLNLKAKRDNGTEEKRLTGRQYKELLGMKARRNSAPDPTPDRREKLPRGDCNDTKAYDKKEADDETCHSSKALDRQANHGTSRFIEYWVPVQLSDVQREQYCATLLSNTMLLCSYSKNDSAESLHDILISTRKCCDHPFLVDHSLRSSVIQGVPMADQLDAEIEISGKLRLLNKILLEIKRRALRVIIVFQKLGGSGLVSVGDILDDFIHQKYGRDSYARIDGDLPLPKKQAAANVFNQKDGGNFVCLIETRACLRGIKLFSVDTVILFDSHWDPLTDIRALQRIDIHSEFEKLKIFRLYSCCTVEEKMLVLAKQGMAVDGKCRNIKQVTSRKLLSWGACYQFSKLTYYDDGYTAPVSHLNVSSEQTSVEDVLCELSALLPDNSENLSYTNSSLISEVQLSGTTYSCNISLFGELKTEMMDNFSTFCQLMENVPSHIFWENLLQGRRPKWKYLPSQSRKTRKKARLPGGFFEESELDRQSRKKVRKEITDIANQTSPKSKWTIWQKLQVRRKKSKFSGEHVTGISVQNEEDMSHGEMLRLEDTPITDHTNAAICSGDIPIQADTPIAELSNEPISSGKMPIQGDIRNGNTATCGAEMLSHADPPIAFNSSASISGGGMPTQTGSPVVELLSTPSQDNAFPTHQEQDLAQPLDSSVQQGISSATLLPPTSLPMDGTNQGPACLGCMSTRLFRQDNHHDESSTVASEVPEPACLAPLQMEINRLQRDKEQAIKMHEEMKSQLQSKREKETQEKIQEIQKKYDLLLQNAEMGFVQRIQDFETFYNKAYLNKLLAGAMIEKHSPAYAAVSQGTQKVTISALLEMCELFTPAGVMTVSMPEQLMDRGERASPSGEWFSCTDSLQQSMDQAAVSSPSIMCSPMTVLPPATLVQSVNNHSEVQHTSLITTSGHRGAKLQVATHSSRVGHTATMTLIPDQSSASPIVTESGLTRALPMPALSSGHRAQLPISTIYYPGSNQVICGVRAPAPHLTNVSCPQGVLTFCPQPLPMTKPGLPSSGNTSMTSNFQDRKTSHDDQHFS